MTFPEDYQAEHLAGQDATFEVTVKEVRRRALPELDDAFANDAAGFETRRRAARGRRRPHPRDRRRARRGRVPRGLLDAAVAHATVEVPDALVEARARELLDRMLHQLEHQGINRDMYFQISGRTEEDLLEESRDDAAQTLRREAVLAAIVEAEGIEPVRRRRARRAAGARPRARTRRRRSCARELEKAGRLDDLRDDLAQRAALDLLVEHATAVPAEPAADEAAGADEVPAE